MSTPSSLSWLPAWFLSALCRGRGLTVRWIDAGNRFDVTAWAARPATGRDPGGSCAGAPGPANASSSRPCWEARPTPLDSRWSSPTLALLYDGPGRRGLAFPRLARALKALPSNCGPSVERQTSPSGPPWAKLAA